jgi:hypothetical protein
MNDLGRGSRPPVDLGVAQNPAFLGSPQSQLAAAIPEAAFLEESEVFLI